MTFKGTSTIDYTHESLTAVKDQLEAFSADYGGTEIYEPLRSAFDVDIEAGFKKRIFLLTDG